MLGKRLAALALSVTIALVLAGVLAPCLALGAEGPGLGMQAATTAEGPAKAAVAKPAITVVNANTGKVAVKKGATYALGAKSAGAKLSYKSSKPSVAKVSSKGKVKALKPGKATVTIVAKKGKAKATKKVAVTVLASKKYKAVKSISAKAAKTSLAMGETTAIKTVFKPAKASNKNLLFSSSNNSVVVVDAKGRVTAVGAGTAKVTVKSPASKKAKATVSFKVSSEDLDSDGDGYSDYVEREILKTDPNKADNSENMPNKTVYDEDAVVVDPSSQHVVWFSDSATGGSGGKVSVTFAKGAATPKVGDVVAIGNCDAAPSGASVKAESVCDNGDGTVTVTGPEPELKDVVTYAKISETLVPDWGNVQLAPGVALEGQGMSVQSDGGSALSPQAGGSKKTIALSLNSSDLSGSVEIGVDSVDFDFEAAPVFRYATIGGMPYGVKVAVDVRRMRVDVRGDFKAEIAQKRDIKNDIDLMKIPVWGALGEGVFLKVALHYELQGKVKLTYEVSYESGFDYAKASGLRLINNFGQPVSTLEAEATAKAGLEPKATAELFGIELAAVGAGSGLAAKASVTLHQKPTMTCTDVGMWVYGEVFAELLGDLDWVELRASYEFWNEDRTPWSAHRHWEDGERTAGDECTWKPDDSKVKSMYHAYYDIIQEQTSGWGEPALESYGESGTSSSGQVFAAIKDFGDGEALVIGTWNSGFNLYLYKCDDKGNTEHFWNHRVNVSVIEGDSLYFSFAEIDGRCYVSDGDDRKEGIYYGDDGWNIRDVCWWNLDGWIEATNTFGRVWSISKDQLFNEATYYERKDQGETQVITESRFYALANLFNSATTERYAIWHRYNADAVQRTIDKRNETIAYLEKKMAEIEKASA